jgi:hypothetical protein
VKEVGRKFNFFHLLSPFFHPLRVKEVGQENIEKTRENNYFSTSFPSFTPLSRGGPFFVFVCKGGERSERSFAGASQGADVGATRFQRPVLRRGPRGRHGPPRLRDVGPRGRRASGRRRRYPSARQRAAWPHVATRRATSAAQEVRSFRYPRRKPRNVRAFRAFGECERKRVATPRAPHAGPCAQHVGPRARR